MCAARRRMADLPGIGYLIAPWSLLSDVRAALLRLGDRLTALEKLMATDRDLLNKLLTALPATLAKVREVMTENQQLRADAEGDEAADTEALRPLEDALNALDAVVNPAAQQEPEVTPVQDVADVPAVVDPAV